MKRMWLRTGNFSTPWPIIFFEEQLIISYIKRSDATSVRKLLPTIKNIGELKNEYLIKLRLAVKIAHPEFKFEDEVEKVDKKEKLIVTERAYELKQHEFRYLTENAIPSRPLGVGSFKEDNILYFTNWEISFKPFTK